MSSSSAETAVSHESEYEYVYDSDDAEAVKPMAQNLRERAQSVLFHRSPEDRIGRAPPTHRSIKNLQGGFARNRSMSSTQRPDFVAPPISDFSRSELPDLGPGSISRFNADVHKDVWFVIDTTSFAKRRLCQVLLSLIGIFRGYDTVSIRLRAILFYDQTVIDPLCYESCAEPVDQKTHIAFGGDHGTTFLSQFAVRRIIR